MRIKNNKWKQIKIYKNNREIIISLKNYFRILLYLVCIFIAVSSDMVNVTTYVYVNV